MPVTGTTPRLIARNRMALAGWIFMAIWLGMLLTFSALFLKEGGFGQFGQPVETGIILVFWLVGMGGASHVFGIPLIRVSRDESRLLVTERWPTRRVTHVVALASLSPPDLHVGKDDDGDPYFRIVLVLPGQDVVLHEGHDHETAELRLRDIRAALA